MLRRITQRQGNSLSPCTSTVRKNKLNKPCQTYFYHYKNAMYMGGADLFRKHQRGILLHDNGLSIITSYHYDLMHGHNIFFKRRCLLSAIFQKNKIIQAVYRTDGFLLFLKYNSVQQIHGNCILINYTTNRIIYVHYRKGNIIQKKQQNQFTIQNQVFELQQLDNLIGIQHSKVLKFNIDKIYSNNILFHQKIGNKFTCGFSKNGFLNGLGFTILIQNNRSGYNPQTLRNQDTFQLTMMQRGYFINSQMNGFGQKWFKNGNSYIGQFKNDIFQGQGILKSSSKDHWVSGLFEKGNLIDIKQYNNQGQIRQLSRIVELMHQRKTNWINNQISFQNLEEFDHHIENIIQLRPNLQAKSLEEKKIQALKRIQAGFISDQKQLESIPYHYQGQYNQDQQSIKKFVRSFMPQNKSQTSDFQRQSTMKQSKSSQQPQEDYSSSRRKAQRSSERMIINSTSRKSKENTSRIFQKQIPSHSVDSLIKLKQVPQFNKTTLVTPNRNTNTGNNHRRNSQFRTEENQGMLSHQISKEHNNVYQPKQILDSKRMIGKSRIFKYLQNSKDDTLPKFHYVHQSPEEKRLRKKNQPT